MKVTMVARDLAPSRALEMVKKELLAKGVEVSAHIGGGKPITSSFEQIFSDARSSNLLFLGMSSSEELAKEELELAAMAPVMGIPYGFYADLFGTSSRHFFEPVRKDARFVFVLSEEEAENTRQIFPNAEVVASGNPVIEGSFWPAKTAEETRAALGVGSEELLMYVTAGKDLDVNKAHFGAVVKALSKTPDIFWKVLVLLHPGDQNPPAAYADVVDLSIMSDSVHIRLLSKKDLEAMGVAALDIIGACDLMVAAVSTSGIEAACLRKPVIDFFSPQGLKRMKEQTGYDVWPPCQFGISRPVMGDVTDLSRAIRDLMTEEGYREMRARQEALFPKPEARGQAVRTMTETLLRILER